MSSPITGTVAWTVSSAVSSIDANIRLGRGVADASETYAYYPCRNNTGRILRLKLSDQTVSQTYGAAWSGFAMDSLELSADGATFYIGRTTTTNGIYTAAVDGSSGSPTQVVTWTAGSSAPAPKRLWRDPVTGYLFLADSVGTLLGYTDPATWSTPASPGYHRPPASLFVGTTGPARYDPDKILWATTTNNSPHVLEYSRRSGHSRALAGDGTTSAASTGGAYATPVGNPTALDSDTDGRIYWGESTGNGKVYSLIDGTIAQVLSANYNGQGGLFLLPQANALLVCNSTYDVRKVT